MDPLTITVPVLCTIVFATYLYVNKKYSYWKQRGVYYLEPKFPYGNIKGLITRKEFFGDTFQRFYKHFKSKGLKGGGIFTLFKPVYVAVDVDLVKRILQKDFEHFVNHGRKFDKEHEPLSGHLFNLENDEWKNLRTKLTPTFTSAKMKMMFQTFVACTLGLVDILKEYTSKKEPVEIKDVVSRFTTDVIGSCAFGIDCNSLKDPNSTFRHYGRILAEPPSLRAQIRNTLYDFLPKPVTNLLKIKRVDYETESFFLNLVKNTVKYREDNKIRRNDFMQLLMQLRNEGKVDGEDDTTGSIRHSDQSEKMMTMNEISAQCFVFFFAGFETSATTMSFALLELAQNQQIQDKLREEIETILKNHNGVVSYEAVMQMSFLDKVIHETLRKHSPGAGVVRLCNKRYRVPDTDVILEPGLEVHIPVLAIHNDPDYYPDPEKFEPQRFNEENKLKRPAFSFLPFGEGPRICIGARFGLLQAKVGLLTIIKNFKVTLSGKTKLPVTYTPLSIVTTPEGGVWLNMVPIENMVIS